MEIVNHDVNSEHLSQGLLQISTTSTLLAFAGFTIASARFAIAGGDAVSRATVAMICLYPLAFNPAFIALTYCEYLSPAQVASVQTDYSLLGRAVPIPCPYKACGRSVGFFNQFVNPIGLKNLGWKYYISHCVWIAVEILIVF